MRILLINVDSRWNMAIRKMYNYYRQNHDVDMIDLGLVGYPHKKYVCRLLQKIFQNATGKMPESSQPNIPVDNLHTEATVYHHSAFRRIQVQAAQIQSRTYRIYISHCLCQIHRLNR